MTVVRRFLLASSLARVVSRERGSTSSIEGYFAGEHGRSSYIVIEGDRSHLVLVLEAPGSARVEERTEVPRRHAEALLNVCAGRVTLERSRVTIDGGGEVLIDRMTHPGLLDTVSVEFDDPDQAAAFAPPVWFGLEITAEPSYERQVIALNVLPPLEDIPLSNATLETLLDLLEGRGSDVQHAATAIVAPSIESSAFEALRRLFPGRSTEPSKPWQAKPEQQGPDIDPVPTQASELSSYEDEQPDADAGAPPEHSVEPEELRSGDADRFAKTNAERSIRSRLFSRLTH
jgi:CYTH domain-containing protein